MCCLGGGEVEEGGGVVEFGGVCVSLWHESIGVLEEVSSSTGRVGWRSVILGVAWAMELQWGVCFD
jgi:hypothetical protein